MKPLAHDRASIDIWWLEERSKVVNLMLTRLKLSDISPGPLGSLPDCSAQRSARPCGEPCEDLGQQHD